MQREAGIAARISIPDQPLGILGIDTQGVGIGATPGRRLSTGTDQKLFGLQVIPGHLPRGTHGHPHVAVIGQFNGMRAMGATRKLSKLLFTGLRIEGNQATLADIHHVNEPVRTKLKVME